MAIVQDELSFGKVSNGQDGIDGLQGPKGEDGIPGPAGADGKTQYTHIAYSNSEDGTLDFSLSDANRIYIGMYVDFEESDSTDPTKYAWTKIQGPTGEDGIPGKPGADGKTPYFHVAYANSVDGTVDFSTTVSANKLYIGQYTDFVAADSTDPTKYSWTKIKGDKGDKGDKGEDGLPGKDGVGVSSTSITYALSDNGETAPSSGWSSSVPTLVKGKYLWTKSVWTYTDNSTETGYSVTYVAKDGNDGNDGVAGKDGVGIKNTVITYATSTSGTTPPTSGWVTTIPSVTPGQFLWTKFVWTYTDNTNETGYAVAKAGEQGPQGPKGDKGTDGIAGKDGIGVTSTVIQYAQSTSGNVVPSTGWTATVPTLIKGQYLWVKTTWNYTDGTKEEGHTVSYNAKDGNDGNDGIPGKDGVGISNTKIEYAASTSGTVKPTSGWNTTIPSVSAGQFLWTRTTWTYTDNTTEVGFTVAKMGETGPKGDQGVPGVPGADGETTYTWVKYADSDTGSGISDNPTGKKYIGFAYNKKTQTESNVASDYTWSLIQGPAGANGNDGKGIKSTDIKYQASTSGTVAPTGTWSATIPSVSQGQYLWTRVITTYTDNQTSTAYSVGRMGQDGQQGTPGKDGEDGADGKEVISGHLTNEAIVVLANASGVVSDFSKANGEFAIYEGQAKITIGFAFSVVNQIGCTVSIDQNGLYKVTAMSTDTGMATFRCTYKGVQIDKVMMISKSKQGPAGTNGQSPHVFQAYAWSADGTDRFTTVYPRENLIKNSKSLADLKVIGEWKTTDSGVYPDYKALNITTTNTNWQECRLELGIPFGEITQYVGVSIEYKEEVAGSLAVTIGAYNGNTRITEIANTCVDTAFEKEVLPNGFTRARYIFETRTIIGAPNADRYAVQFKRAPGKSNQITIVKPKVEVGSPTIYTPSPSEDYANAYPTYFGHYVSFDATQSTNPADYTWQRAMGEQGVDGEDGRDGVAGKDGKGVKSTTITYALSTVGNTPPTTGWTTTVPTLIKGQYLWTKTVWTYTDNTTETGHSVTYVAKDGNNGTDGVAGKDGVGISSTVIEYVGSTSGTVRPSTGWSTTIPTVAAGSFLWTRTTWKYTDGTSEQGFSVAQMGKTGPQGPQGPQGPTGPTGPAGNPTGVTESTTVPANPYIGMLWKNTGTPAGYVKDSVYRWNGSKWDLFQFSAVNILAETFNGLTFNGLTFNGTTFNNSGEYSKNGQVLEFSTKNQGMIATTWKVKNQTQNGMMNIDPIGISSYSYADAAKQEVNWYYELSSVGLSMGDGQSRSSLNPPNMASFTVHGITITDRTLSPTYGSVNLSFQDLMTRPKTAIPASSGFTQYNSSTSSANCPTAQRLGRVVQLAGAFRNSNTIPAGSAGLVMGVLPVWARPATTVNTIVQGTGANVYLLTVVPDGTLNIERYRGGISGGFEYKDCGAGSWLNIATVYAAGDI